MSVISRSSLSVRRHDALAQTTIVGTAFYLDELNRHETARASDKMIELTAQLRLLTLVVTGATLVALAISVVALIRT